MKTKNPSKIGSAVPEISDDDDRLSSLPDELIAHVLSFLDTKHAVGTAVLSRRWKNRWAGVSNLDFDNRLVYKSQDEAQTLEPVPDLIRRRYLLFTGFVDKVLNQHENLNSVKRFRFHWYWTMLPETRFERELVFGPRMEEIDVRISELSSYGRLRYVRCIPGKFYTLKNLRVVKLDGVFLGAAKESVFLPVMRILHLFGVLIADLESLERLISGCPALEALHLGRCHGPGKHIEVSLPSLKDLRVRKYTCFPIVIEAPNLEDLSLEQHTKVRFKGTSPLSCLHSAHVDAGEGCRASYRDLYGLLTQISNAEKIHLSGNLGHLSIVSDFQLPVFPNLTHLTIGIGHTTWVLRSFLRAASKLQSLVIDMEKDLRDPIKWKSIGTACTPHCLSSSLQEIVIKELYADEGERKLIAYLLKAGAVLKKVNLHINGCYLKKCCRKDIVSLLKLSRRSSACKVRLFSFPNIEYVCFDSDNETNANDNRDDDFDDTDEETDNEYETDNEDVTSNHEEDFL